MGDQNYNLEMLQQADEIIGMSVIDEHLDEFAMRANVNVAAQKYAQTQPDVEHATERMAAGDSSFTAHDISRIMHPYVEEYTKEMNHHIDYILEGTPEIIPNKYQRIVEKITGIDMHESIESFEPSHGLTCYKEGEERVCSRDILP